MHILTIYRIHYFIYWGSLCCVLNFAQLFAKHHILASPTDIGDLYSILPCLLLMMKPIFCTLADRFAWHRSLMFISLLISSLGFSSLIAIPYLPKTFPLWGIFCAQILTASIASGIMNSLTDSLVLKVTDMHGSNFGQIRAWGTFGWGMFTLFLGQLNSIDTHILPLYVPGLILFAILSFINCLFVLFYFRHLLPPALESQNEASIKSIDPLPSSINSLSSRSKVNRKGSTLPNETVSCSLSSLGSTHHNESMVKIVLLTFVHHPRLIQYALLCTLIGVLTSVHWQFFAWFLDTLSHQDSNLIANTAVVQCFLGEIPLMYFASQVVEWIGIQASLNLVLLTFSIRYFYYTQLNTHNVYWVLAIEFTQGITFGLFYFLLNRLAADYGVKASKLQRQRMPDRRNKRSEAIAESSYSNQARTSGVQRPSVSKSDDSSGIDNRATPSFQIQYPVLGHYDQATPRRATVSDAGRSIGSKDEVDCFPYATPSATTPAAFESCCWHTAQKDFPHDEFNCVHQLETQTPDMLRSMVGTGFDANLTTTSLNAMIAYDQEESPNASSTEVLPSHTSKSTEFRSIDQTDGCVDSSIQHSSNFLMHQSRSNRCSWTDNDPPMSLADSQIFASIQGILSACYEGLGVAIGTFVSGHLIQNFGFVQVWIGGSAMAAITLFINLTVALIVFITKRVRSSSIDS